VLRPLVLGSMEFKRDRHGNPLAASGFELTAHEWARFGELVLHHGSYNGHQVVSGNLLGEALTRSAANPSYGLTFWLNRQAPGAREIDIEKELELPWQRARWQGICVSQV